MKSNKRRRLIIITIMLLAAILACNKPQSSPTDDVASVVSKTQTAMAVSQLLTPNTTVPAATPPITPEQPSQPTANNPGITPVVSAVPPVTSAPPISQNCTNLAKFEGEAIPDNSAFAPGQEFMKIWTLRNAGSCVWTQDYTLVFIKGEQMGGAMVSPIGQTVQPNDTIQVYLPQKAPDSTGEHQGFWMLSNPSGQPFGLGPKADVAFWVKIQVTPGSGNHNTGSISGPQNLGAPTWSETFDNKSNPWYLGADSDIRFDVDNGSLVMTAFEPIGDQWRVAENSYIDNFYLQASFKSGTSCAGKDGYGLIVRAPNKASGVINSGYVFSFSCDGQYRVYRMDNGNYLGLINWTSVPALKAGPNQANSMGIYAKGDKLQLYANGALLTELADNTYPAGLFGLVIRSEVTKNFQAFVTDVAYWLIR